MKITKLPTVFYNFFYCSYFSYYFYHFCLFLFSLLFSLLNFDFAFAEYRATGWQWYSSGYVDYHDIENEENKHKGQGNQKKQKNKKNQKEVFSFLSNNSTRPISYTAQMKAFNAYAQEVHNKAVITQNVEDVARDSQLQYWMMEQAKNYGIAKAKALVKYPYLSYETKFPTAQIARQVAYSEKVKQQNNAIKHLAKTYGLIYFYRGKNAYDQAMSDSIGRFANQYGMALVGLPVDGVNIKAISVNKPLSIVNALVNKLKLRDFPAIMLINPNTGRVIALTYGFVALDEIKKRMLEEATNYGKGIKKLNSNDYGGVQYVE